MNWNRQSAWLMTSGAYKVAKFMDSQFAQYRASRSGQFIGSVVGGFEAAQTICENNRVIMGDDLEQDE